MATTARNRHEPLPLVRWLREQSAIRRRKLQSLHDGIRKTRSAQKRAALTEKYRLELGRNVSTAFDVDEFQRLYRKCVPRNLRKIPKGIEAWKTAMLYQLDPDSEQADEIAKAARLHGDSTFFDAFGKAIANTDLGKGIEDRLLAYKTALGGRKLHTAKQIARLIRTHMDSDAWRRKLCEFGIAFVDARAGNPGRPKKFQTRKR